MTDRACFGLPSVFNPASEACTGCAARRRCGEASIAVLQKIRSVVDVEAKIQALRLEFAGVPASAPITLEQSRSIASLPVKLQARIRRLFEARFDQAAKQSLAVGENPFPKDGNKASRLAGELLLAGSFTKAQFRTACMERFNWTYPTAATESSVALALLKGLGLVRFDGGVVHAA